MYINLFDLEIVEGVKICDSVPVREAVRQMRKEGRVDKIGEDEIYDDFGVFILKMYKIAKALERRRNADYLGEENDNAISGV
ncbi:MAG: hypothetical protein WC516_06285 [Patescibacteria group bacterium]|jgi:hypothetical protein